MQKLIYLLFFLLSFPVFALDYGIDRLDEETIAKKLVGKNLAVLTHAAAQTKSGTHLIDILYKKFTLKKIFAPEHGLRTIKDDWVEDGVDEATNLPVISLYKRESKAPTPEDLIGIDAIVIDLQDVGVRFYTYFSTIAEVMKSTAPLKIEVIILDRPNLLGGNILEGKVLDPHLVGRFIAYHTVPTRHGMTLGELAFMYNAEKKLGSDLTVIPAKGWKRERLVFSNERAWLPPSPALISIDQVGLYALWGSLEHFNLSVGRGLTNERAFRLIAAPWITKSQSQELSHELNKLGFKEVTFAPFSGIASRAIYAGMRVKGVSLNWSGKDVRTDEFTYKVSSTLVRLLGEKIVPNTMLAASLGSQSMLNAIMEQKSWENYRQRIDSEIVDFKIRRSPYLLY